MLTMSVPVEGCWLWACLLKVVVLETCRVVYFYLIDSIMY